MKANTIWHPFWDLSAFERPRHAEQDPQGGTARPSGIRYPLRAVRYWLMDHLLRGEAAQRGQPLRICEVGVGDGALLAFVNESSRSRPGERPPWAKTWDAMSLRIDRDRLKAIGYNHCIEADVEQRALEVTGEYEVLIFLHLLEHLYDPEAAVARLLPALKPNGLVIGGAPALPDLLRRLRERQLRKDAEPFGHVSVISVARIKQLARTHNLRVELLTGAWLTRATGSVLENHAVWLRLNLAFGALLPRWPGELYWALRVPPTLPWANEPRVAPNIWQGRLVRGTGIGSRLLAGESRVNMRVNMRIAKAAPVSLLAFLMTVVVPSVWACRSTIISTGPATKTEGGKGSPRQGARRSRP